MNRSRLTFVLKLILSCLLLWFVLSRLTWSEVHAALSEPAWSWLAAALAVYGVSAWGGALQWSWLLQAAGLKTAPGEMRRLYLVGLFFNNFLPANIGGDAYKIVDLGRREGCPAAVFGATLLDRLVGLAALTLFAALSALACRLLGIALPRVVWVLAAVLILLLVALIALISRRFGRFVQRSLRTLRLPTVADRAELMAREFLVYRQRLPWLGRLLVFSVGVQALRLAVHLLVAFGLRLEPTPEQILQLLVLVPLLALSLTLPVTINGIGLRETVTGALLVSTGLSSEGVVAMEMVAFLIMVAFSLVGGALWWRRRGLLVAPASTAGPPPGN